MVKERAFSIKSSNSYKQLNIGSKPGNCFSTAQKHVHWTEATIIALKLGSAIIIIQNYDIVSCKCASRENYE